MSVMTSAAPPCETSCSNAALASQQVFVGPGRGSYQMVEKLVYVGEGNGNFDLGPQPQEIEPPPDSWCGIQNCTYKKAKVWACKAFYLSTIAMIVLCLLAGTIGLAVTMGRRGIEAAQKASGGLDGPRKAFLHHPARKAEVVYNAGPNGEAVLKWHHGLEFTCEGLSDSSSEERRSWCCDKHSMGCPVFDCKADIPHEGDLWAAVGKRWCCNHHRGHCPKVDRQQVANEAEEKQAKERWEKEAGQQSTTMQWTVAITKATSTTQPPWAGLAFRRTPEEQQALTRWQTVIKKNSDAPTERL